VTYSLLTRCPRTGRFGIGIASYSIAIGTFCDGLRANTGVTISQAFPRPGNNMLALRLLAQGFTPNHVLADLVADDPNHEYRQIGIIDRVGNIAVRSGAELRPWCGQVIGDSFVALGDMLSGQSVLDAMVAAFLSNPDAELEERLLSALESGRDAGGQVGRAGHLPERSAAVVVCGNLDYYDWDLRVDVHDNAVTELRRIHEEYKPHAAYYIDRGRNPHNAIPAMEFSDMLHADRPTSVS
jgi:uncharacterized Ntn-hydrolase superfamily protein